MVQYLLVRLKGGAWAGLEWLGGDVREPETVRFFWVWMMSGEMG